MVDFGVKPGDRVRLLRTTDIFTKLEPGAEGTVRFIDDAHTVHCDWDDGSTLGLCWPEDRWEKIASPPQ